MPARSLARSLDAYQQPPVHSPPWCETDSASQSDTAHRAQHGHTVRRARAAHATRLASRPRLCGARSGGADQCQRRAGERRRALST
ncbi:hypothetical protein GUJ93_ZPchr0006g44212 [Zizania palustris]|uniref:Uncharacterized protein n=1 Tax=Zizania palustris TaxID=103762 RepID=A0A8J5T014_ZIZPA|nr:hypothetical protein GUJ93_ZPchr0006g44212 [Zizania palustris]